MERNLEMPLYKEYNELTLKIARNLTPGEKLELTSYLTQIMRDASRAALRWCNPNATDDEIGVMMVSHYYGQELGNRFGTHLKERRQKEVARTSEIENEAV